MKTQRLTNISKAALAPLAPFNYAPDMSNDKRHLNFFQERFPRMIHQSRVKYCSTKPSLTYLSGFNPVFGIQKTSFGS